MQRRSNHSSEVVGHKACEPPGWTTVWSALVGDGSGAAG